MSEEVFLIFKRRKRRFIKEKKVRIFRSSFVRARTRFKFPYQVAGNCSANHEGPRPMLFTSGVETSTNLHACSQMVPVFRVLFNHFFVNLKNVLALEHKLRKASSKSNRRDSDLFLEGLNCPLLKC